MISPLQSERRAELLAYRTKLGLSQAKFADVIGLSRSTISRMDNGTCHIDKVIIMAIRYLDMTKSAADAYRAGRIAGRVEGQESQFIYNPYDDETQSYLYSEWQRGFDDA